MICFHYLRAFFFILILLNFRAFAQQAEDYQKTYKEEYQDALNYLKQNKTYLYKQLTQNQADASVIISAVFPEIVRFSEVKNMLETASLEILYVRFGNVYADFSIGRFQIKPSFVEKLETYIQEFALYKEYEKLLEYEYKDEKSVRQERINRLKTLEWQLKYLNCFYVVVSRKFGKSWTSHEDKIRFFAAAYNRGFEHSQEEITRWISLKAFPYGLKYRGKQYAYTDISVHFYRNYWKQIF